ncbi:MAG TPA: DUF4926 domain-containing protein [Candidatus Melainabacteria bacterium]|nr:DUF4926 domain-containing protein [Candidatus Melainabacteria bacterium]HIN64780.1 DUF4926 domain-containing protein [Candidatus Obscuribacterales bacterium]
MFKQYDIVRITKPQTGEWGTLRTGTKGTIIEVYKVGPKVGYDVEFVTSTGRTKAIVTLGAKDIEPATVTKAAGPVATAKVAKPAAGAKVAMTTTRSKASALTSAKGMGPKKRPAAVSKKKR